MMRVRALKIENSVYNMIRVSLERDKLRCADGNFQSYSILNIQGLSNFAKTTVFALMLETIP